MSRFIKASVAFPFCRLVLLLGPFSWIAPLAAEDATTLDDVLRVWRKREEATRSVEFAIATEFLTTRGPPKPRKENERWSVTIDGVKMRYERFATIWNDAVSADVPEEVTEVFDGTIKQVLHYRDRPDDAVFSQGWINKSDKHPTVNSIYLSPILKHYRPFAYGIVKVDGLRLVSTKESVDGIPCFLVEESLPALARVAKYWVAPGQDMAIVRYTRQFRGKPELQLEVSFKSDPVHGWMPDRWSAARFTGGTKIIDSATSVITTKALNLEVPANKFAIVFPTGTLVYDDIAGKNLVVQADGTHREVLPGESMGHFR